MWSFIALTVIMWMTYAAFAQEYLPPKIGGGGAKKPALPEPTLPANYEFSYDVQDSGVNLDFGHNEKRKDDRATGSYHVLLPDGRTQLVEYEAGPDGFKPQIMYMGTATFPAAAAAGGDKFDGYHYSAAASRHAARQAARPLRQTTSAPVSGAPPPPADTGITK